MTDREDNSFWSSSEDEDNGKPVPQWAKGPRIAAALERQKPVDPDQIFPAMPMSCDLEGSLPLQPLCFFPPQEQGRDLCRVGSQTGCTPSAHPHPT